ncbi:Lsr2 family protein [Citricoccus zhacaiensis]|uniref:Lsr2 family protein n=3 Tax=Citricoccus TaxID=169133 RepID=A0ABV5G915_9MICC|nr:MULTISPECIES: Lsr2 family protein [Citricoccus]GGO49992.1 Lsr2 family protein [Citricoccus zhacaiensis]VXC18688.1 Nucleoid-associated protein Lsr2 [Citricoccus sp. K5]
MAQKAQVVLIDDLDGSPAKETVSFGLDGRHYEIDLSTANAKQLRGELTAYVRQGRATAPQAPPRPAAAIRQWAQQNGYDVSARGRIHQDILEAYNNAEQT